jgi:hypothetical protein
LRRDLHDGLGPVLTGIAFRADAAGNVLRDDPERAEVLLRELRASATDAIGDVRRLVYDLVRLRWTSWDWSGRCAGMRSNSTVGGQRWPCTSRSRCQRCAPPSK